MSPLGLDALEVTRVFAADDFVDKATIGAEVFEVARTPQQQCVLDGALEMTVGTFDRAVFVSDPAVVASRFHPIVSAQYVVARGQILSSRIIQIAERRRQALTAVLAGSPSQCPQRVLQPFGQSHIALTSEDHVRMLEPGVNQPEVVEPVIKGE